MLDAAQWRAAIQQWNYADRQLELSGSLGGTAVLEAALGDDAGYRLCPGVRSVESSRDECRAQPHQPRRGDDRDAAAAAQRSRYRPQPAAG